MAYVPPHTGDYKSSVRVVATANVPLAAPGSTLDGVTLASGDRLLLTGQTNAAQNGVYVWTGPLVALTRARDADTAKELNTGAQVPVEEGSAAGTTWVLITPSPIDLGTTALTFMERPEQGEKGDKGDKGDQGNPGQDGVLPPAVFLWTAELVAPVGYLLAFGQFVQQASFPILYGKIGHRFNNGIDPGDGTFRIPDARGRTIFGDDAAGGSNANRIATANALAASGGVAAALIALNEMPSHTHGGTTGNQSVDHTHSGTTGNDNTEHTHSGSTGTMSSDHGHSGSTGGISVNHTHVANDGRNFQTANGANIVTPAGAAYTLVQNNSNSVAGATGTVSADHGHAFSTGGISANHTHAFTTGGRSAFHQHAITTGGVSANHTHSFTTGVPTGYAAQTALSKLPPYLILNPIISTGATYTAPSNVAEMIPRSVFGAAGDLLVAAGNNAEGVLPAPTSSGLIIVSDLAQAKRMGWADRLPPVPASSGLALVANTAQSSKMEWADRHAPVPTLGGKVLLSDLAAGSKQRWQGATEELPLLVPWTQLPLQGNPTGATGVGNWWNYAAPYGPVRFCKTADGTVHIKGLIQYSSTAGSNYIVPVGGLPAGCRPSQTLLRHVYTSADAVNHRCDISADGSLYQYDIPLNMWVSLDFCFKAEQ